MAYEATGKLEVIYPTQQVTDKFRKREFVLEIDGGMYPEHIKMQLVQEKCDVLDGFQTGEEVKVMFDLKGRPYQKQGETIYFTNLQAWKVEKVGGQASSAPAPNSSPAQEDVSGLTFTEDGDGELPF